MRKVSPLFGVLIVLAIPLLLAVAIWVYGGSDAENRVDIRRQELRAVELERKSLDKPLSDDESAELAELRRRIAKRKVDSLGK